MRLLGLVVLCAVVAAAILVGAVWFGVELDSRARIYTNLADIPPAKAGLVLGSSRLLRDYVANPYFQNRITAAAALYHVGKVEYLIVSGNQARGGRPRGGYDEPADMRSALIEAGVPADRIYRDYAGFRTLDSVLRARLVFGQDRVIVVSQQFHLARALFLAERHGIQDDGYEAQAVPQRYAAKTQIREVAARVAALIDVTINTPPRFVGKPVELGVDPPT